jgi:hypothetical protein
MEFKINPSLSTEELISAEKSENLPSPPQSAGYFGKFRINNKIKIIAGSLIMAVVLLFEIFFGIKNAKIQKQTETVLKNQQQIALGLKFFYNDYGRFPQAGEFASRSIMGNYFTAFPVPEITVANCPQSFSYKQLTEKKIELNFCLPSAALEYQSGWNKFVLEE